MLRESQIRSKTKSEMVRVNKFNHSAAILAQITAQINSGKGKSFELGQFLPYPQVSNRNLDMPVELARTFLSTIKNLDTSLFIVASDSKILGEISAHYWWKSGGWLYEN